MKKLTESKKDRKKKRDRKKQRDRKKKRDRKQRKTERKRETERRETKRKRETKERGVIVNICQAAGFRGSESEYFSRIWVRFGAIFQDPIYCPSDQ